MAKKIHFTARPSSRQAAADQWVARHEKEEPKKTLTLELPASLHKNIKVSCAKRGERMNLEIRAILEKHYENEE